MTPACPLTWSKWPKDRSQYNSAQQDDSWKYVGGDTGIRTGPQDGTGREVIYDAEGDGLLHASGKARAVTQFWCIAVVDIHTGEEFYWGIDLGTESIEHGIRFLAQCKRIIAHNGIGYDYPATERLYPWWVRPEESWDSLVIAKVIWPYETLIGPDLARIRKGLMPGNLLKAHSLKAWGYRTGTRKGEYEGGFDEWCPAMASYLMGDIRGTLALWRLIEKRLGWDANVDPTKTLVWDELTLWYENEVARIIFEQEECGVNFDKDKAIKLSAELADLQADIEVKLKETFGSWWQPLDDPETGRVHNSTMHRKLNEYPDVTLARYSEKTGKRLKDYVGPPLEEITEGSASCRVEWTTFNPSSRDHLGMRLQAVYGWQPKAFGKDGKPTVDETTLEQIPDAVMPADIRQLILDYFVVSKTLGTLTKGRKSWLNLCGEDGRIHGRMDTVGAVTRRGTHKDPNLSGTPSVSKEKGPDGKEHVVRGLRGRFGWECRELFIADDGWELTGIDASALELIDLGHYLAPLDDGVFSARVCDKSRDPHAENAKDAGGILRADAKTTIYLLIYGGSAYKLSLAIQITDDEIPAMLNYRGLSALLRNLEKRFDADFVRKLDDRQKAKIAKARQIIVKLQGGIKGLKQLMEDVQREAEKGWLKGLDGSKLTVRKAYAALNTMLQSAGAMSCKLWMALLHKELKARGLKLGVDFKQVLWVHDELQITHRPGLGPLIREAAEECMVKAGEMLGLRGRYRTDGKTGSNWAECH